MRLNLQRKVSLGASYIEMGDEISYQQGIKMGNQCCQPNTTRNFNYNLLLQFMIPDPRLGKPFLFAQDTVIKNTVNQGQISLLSQNPK